MEGRWSRLGTDAMMDGARPAGGPDHRPVTKGNHCFLVNIFAHRDRPPGLTGVESLSLGSPQTSRFATRTLIFINYLRRFSRLFVHFVGIISESNRLSS